MRKKDAPTIQINTQFRLFSLVGTEDKSTVFYVGFGNTREPDYTIHIDKSIDNYKALKTELLEKNINHIPVIFDNLRAYFWKYEKSRGVKLIADDIHLDLEKN